MWSLLSQRPLNSNFPSEFNPPVYSDENAEADENLASDTEQSSGMVKSTIGLAIGGILILLIIGLGLFAVRTVRRRIQRWKSGTNATRETNVVTFVNELVSSNVKTVSEEPLNNGTLSRNPNPKNAENPS